MLRARSLCSEPAGGARPLTNSLLFVSLLLDSAGASWGNASPLSPHTHCPTSWQTDDPRVRVITSSPGCMLPGAMSLGHAFLPCLWGPCGGWVGAGHGQPWVWGGCQ